MRGMIIVSLLLAACAKDPGQAGSRHDPGAEGGACFTDRDCPPEMWCLHQRCSARATPAIAPGDAAAAELAASPESLNFGGVTPPASRTLAVVVANVGERLVTLSRVRVSPEGSPFRIESLGYGPFWIRPGRSRDVFVTFVPTTGGHVEATLVLESEAPPKSVTLLGN